MAYWYANEQKTVITCGDGRFIPMTRSNRDYRLLDDAKIEILDAPPASKANENDEISLRDTSENSGV
jgi:hypothetical protein